MHPARMLAPWAIPLLLVAMALAGCAGRPEETNAPSPGSTTQVTSSTPPTSGGVSGFQVIGLRIAPASGADRPLHEDDAARITYTLRNGGTTTEDFLVSYLLNGKVEDLQHVTLPAGGTKDVAWTLPDLHRVRDIRVEVKAGNEKATAEATVSEWPRTGDRVDLGPLALTVNRWLKDQANGGTAVNVTVERRPEPEGNYSLLRVHVLCLAEDGAIAPDGLARPNAPEPGTAAMTDLLLPGCPHMLYGIEVTGEDAATEDIYARILFVERGWTPTG